MQSLKSRFTSSCLPLTSNCDNSYNRGIRPHSSNTSSKLITTPTFNNNNNSNLQPSTTRNISPLSSSPRARQSSGKSSVSCESDTSTMRRDLDNPRLAESLRMQQNTRYLPATAHNFDSSASTPTNAKQHQLVSQQPSSPSKSPTSLQLSSSSSAASSSSPSPTNLGNTLSPSKQSDRHPHSFTRSPSSSSHTKPCRASKEFTNRQREGGKHSSSREGSKSSNLKESSKQSSKEGSNTKTCLLSLRSPPEGSFSLERTMFQRNHASTTVDSSQTNNSGDGGSYTKDSFIRSFIVNSSQGSGGFQIDSIGDRKKYVKKGSHTRCHKVGDQSGSRNDLQRTGTGEGRLEKLRSGEMSKGRKNRNYRDHHSNKEGSCSNTNPQSIKLSSQTSMSGDNGGDIVERKTKSMSHSRSEIKPPTSSIGAGGIPYVRTRRTAVSSESVTRERMENWTPPVFPKTHAETVRIRAVIHNKLALLFGHLRADGEAAVVQAMFKREIAKGVSLIKQGDEGDNFYIVDSGQFDIYVARLGSPAVKVSEATPGMSFGELALMYNSPRAATCTAVVDSVVWALDRTCFQMMLVTSENTKKRRYEELLEHIEILKGLTKYERSQLSDILSVQNFEEGDCVIRQGDRGDKFYIVESGELICRITQDGSDEEVEVHRYERGGYFGELALISTLGVRRASVYAAGPNTCLLWINKATFDRVLGPIVDILKKNADKYPTYADIIKTSRRENL